MILIGLAGGAIGFWGFFVNCFHHPNSGLDSTSSVWFDSIPIVVGIGAIGLAIPGGLKPFTSGLPLLSMGIALTIQGVFGGLARDIRGSSMRLRVVHDLDRIWRLDPRLIGSGGVWIRETRRDGPRVLVAEKLLVNL